MQLTCKCAAAFFVFSITSQFDLSAQVAAPISSPPANSGPAPISLTNTPEIPPITVLGRLNESRKSILPSLGATDYTLDQNAIEDQPQGANIPFSHLVLRFPGVSEDSAASGSFHVRDEHANVQYRIDDVLIPESITSFGSQFDTEFIDHIDLITGALPAQYGFRTSGILDIHTKNSALNPGGDAELYGGSYETLRPSFQYGNAVGRTSYYLSGSFMESDLGIENPTPDAHAIHDQTDQYRGFAEISFLIDENDRLSFIAGEAYNQYEIPNTPGQPPAVDGAGNPFLIPGAGPLNSAALNEKQREQNKFEVLSYQKSASDLNFQLSLFNSYSAVNYQPDELGDLIFNGVAGVLDRDVLSNGVQLDGSDVLNDSHTLRTGLLLNAQFATQYAVTTVIPENPATGAQSGAPETFSDRDNSTAFSCGFYVQDEWKINKQLTMNFGGRFDIYQSSFIRQNQLSPRLNLTYDLDKNTRTHLGYASYFTPPPLENIPQGTIKQFANTSAAADPDLPNNAVESERAHYFDVGMTRQIGPEYKVGLDGYYKISQNTLDDGQFGAAPILSAFNYRRGQIAGLELTQNYASRSGFSIYANFALEQGIGTGWNSAQAVLFNTADYNYVKNHYIYLDHSQTFTGSVGVGYVWNETRPYLEVITGSGFRQDAKGIPNGGSLPAYDSVNMGLTQGFKWAHLDNLSARFDVINVGDQIYELRSGTGVGVFAPQYGQRRGVYGGVSYRF